VILLDTSGLVANYDRDDPHHADAARVLAESRPRLLSPFVLAELDYLITRLVGQVAEQAVLTDVANGAFELAAFGMDDVGEAQAVIRQYSALTLDLADASLVVLSRRYSCTDLLTLDQRHFRAVAGAGGHSFRLLPDDSASV
jgi:predicted nucleic acid-binding protein